MDKKIMQTIPKIFISIDPLNEHVYKFTFENKIFQPDYNLLTNYLYEEIIKYLQAHKLEYPNVSPKVLKEIYADIFTKLDIESKVYYLHAEDLWFINKNCLDHFIFDERSQMYAFERADLLVRWR